VLSFCRLEDPRLGQRPICRRHHVLRCAVMVHDYDNYLRCHSHLSALMALVEGNLLRSSSMCWFLLQRQ
jgi:hypothetical protein